MWILIQSLSGFYSSPVTALRSETLGLWGGNTPHHSRSNSLSMFWDIKICALFYLIWLQFGLGCTVFPSINLVRSSRSTVVSRQWHYVHYIHIWSVWNHLLCTKWDDSFSNSLIASKPDLWVSHRQQKAFHFPSNYALGLSLSLLGNLIVANE